MPKKDLHLTIEQLSAYLDGQLSPEEQVHCDTHLKACEQCQQLLAELRLVAHALHVLPQPELPRSFVLPATFVTIEMEESARAAIEHRRPDGRITMPASLHPSTRPRRQPWPGFITGTLRAASTLAAVAGILLLLSSLLLSLPYIVHTSGGSATSNTTAGSSYPVMQPAPSPTPTPKTASSPRASSETPQAAPTITMPSPPGERDIQGTPQDTQTPSILSWLNALNPATPGGSALLGIILLVLSFGGFHLLRRLRNLAS